MPTRVDLRLQGTILALVGILLLLAMSADAALVRVGRIVVRADGGFAPTTLPRNTYVPIRFHGWADISSTDSAPPPELRSVVLDFDRAGKLQTRGLPVCRPDRIETAPPNVARRRCATALVGKGTVAALVTLPGAPVTVRSPLSIFNGPRVGGRPTVLGHAQSTIPKRETYVVVASKGGDPDHPDWYKNLQANPEVEVQIKGDRFRAGTRTAGGEERQELWRLMTATWPDYDEYTKKTDREIPVVVLEPIR